MPAKQSQCWITGRLTVERCQDASDRSLSFRFSGPCTARDLYESISPAAWRRVFKTSRKPSEFVVYSVDLTQVPYIDFACAAFFAGICREWKAQGARVTVMIADPRVFERIEARLRGCATVLLRLKSGIVWTETSARVFTGTPPIRDWDSVLSRSSSLNADNLAQPAYLIGSETSL